MNDPEAHDDGSETYEPCYECGVRDEDAVKCASADCELYFHKRCADHECEACAQPLCDAHAIRFADVDVCAGCLPDLELIEREGIDR